MGGTQALLSLTDVLSCIRSHCCSSRSSSSRHGERVDGPGIDAASTPFGILGTLGVWPGVGDHVSFEFVGTGESFGADLTDVGLDLGMNLANVSL